MLAVILGKKLIAKSLLLALFWILGSTGLMAQISPHSALKNFRLPKYNDNSYRAYTLSGSEGFYSGDGSFRVFEAKLALYSGDEVQRLETTVESDEAIIDLNTDLAFGKSRVQIEDEDFFLQGEEWRLDMSKKQIRIENGGSIRFYQELELDLADVF